MTNSSEERGESAQRDNASTGISDADLPEDLVAHEDNPLAEPLDDDVSREELAMGTPGPLPDGDEDDDKDDEG